jgi:hypothetical protein
MERKDSRNRGDGIGRGALTDVVVASREREKEKDN